MKCPFCKNESLSLLTDTIRSGPGEVLYCAECDVGFLKHFEAQEDLAEYYKNEYWKTHGPELGRDTDYEEKFEAYVGFQGRRLQLLEPYLNPHVRLLEIGCATGQFLYNVKDKVKEAVGVDYDGGAVEFAQTKTGCKTYGNGLENADLEKNSFDIVCAFQTLEHVADPESFMKMVGEYLKPDGLVVIEVPNLYDPLMALYANPSYTTFYYHSEHLYYFTEKSLSNVMRRSGYSGEVHYVQDYNFTNHMNWVYCNAPQPNGRVGLGQAGLSLAKTLPENVAEDFNQWLNQVDLQYKEFLAQNKITENITFIGKKM